MWHLSLICIVVQWADCMSGCQGRAVSFRGLRSGDLWKINESGRRKQPNWLLKPPEPRAWCWCNRSRDASRSRWWQRRPLWRSLWPCLETKPEPFLESNVQSDILCRNILHRAKNPPHRHVPISIAKLTRMSTSSAHTSLGGLVYRTGKMPRYRWAWRAVWALRVTARMGARGLYLEIRCADLQVHKQQ